MFERFATRATALGLSGLITLSIVTALANTADHRHALAHQAFAASVGGTQQVVVTGQRQPRS